MDRAAWERFGTGLRCKEHDEAFPIGSGACSQCSSRRTASPAKSAPIPTPIPPELTVAALSDAHPLLTHAGRKERLAELADSIVVGEPMSQGQKFAASELRACIELLAKLEAGPEMERRVAALEASNAELMERLDNAGRSEDEAIPPMVEATH